MKVRDLGVMCLVIGATALGVWAGHTVDGSTSRPFEPFELDALNAGIDHLEAADCNAVIDIDTLRDLANAGPDSPFCIETNDAINRATYGTAYPESHPAASSGINMSASNSVWPAALDLGGGHSPLADGHAAILGARVYHEWRHFDPDDDDPGHAQIYADEAFKFCELATSMSEDPDSGSAEGVRNLCKAMEDSIDKAQSFARADGNYDPDYGEVGCDVCAELCEDDDRELDGGDGSGGSSGSSGDDEEASCPCGDCPDDSGGDGDDSAPARSIVSVPLGAQVYSLHPGIRSQIDSIYTDTAFSPVIMTQFVGMSSAGDVAGLADMRRYIAHTDTAELHIYRWNPELSPYGGPGEGATQKLTVQFDFKPYAMSLLADEDSLVVAGRTHDLKTVVRRLDFDFSGPVVSLATTTLFHGASIGVVTGLAELEQNRQLILLDAGNSVLWRLDLDDPRQVAMLVDATQISTLQGARSIEVVEGTTSPTAAQYLLHNHIRDDTPPPNAGPILVIEDFEVFDEFVDNHFEVSP